jgi:excisionase family DNA binding protein
MSLTKEKIRSHIQTQVDSAEPPRMMTRLQAAEYIGLKKQTLDAWACAGRNDLPYVKLGRAVRYCREDLDAWLERNSRTHTGQSAE